jgi:hypothetical protein
MSEIKHEDIVGYYVGEKLVCKDCMTDEELKAVKEDEVLTVQDAEKNDDRVYFCDRGGKRIY